MSKIKYGKTMFYKDYTDNHFVNSIVLKEKKIKNNYQYIPKCFLVRWWFNLFYYVFAMPILKILMKCKYHVKVYGKKNMKGMKGCIFIGNHTNVMDGCFASAVVASPKRNYIITNKDAVQVVLGKYFTKALGALPLPDDNRGLLNLAESVDILLKQGHAVTIFPEATIWPYYTKLRPMPAASFHYAVKSNVPVIPFAVTYRYAKGKNYLKKKPKVNITICEPIYPDLSLPPKERKIDLSVKTMNSLRPIIEGPDNVALYNYVQIDDKENGKNNPS